MKSILKISVFLVSILIFTQVSYSQTNSAGSNIIQISKNTNEYKKNILKVSSKDVIVITATKTEVKRSDIGASVTVITAEDIQKQGLRTVSDALKNVPGVTVSQSSIFGGLSSVYIRGLNNSGQLLVMIDGIEMNDPMHVSKAFNFANLTTGNIEQIEIIRGPQNTLYGSDAISGVINIITKKGKGRLNVELFSEVSSFETFNEHICINGSGKKINYSLMISRMDTEGISKAAKAENAIKNTEKDDYANTTVSSRIGYNPYANLQLTLFLHYIYAKMDIDDGAYSDDPNHINTSKNFNGRFEIKYIINSQWDNKLSYSYMKLNRIDKDNNDEINPIDFLNSWYKGDTSKIEWQHNFYINDMDTITFGFEYEKEKGSSYYDSISKYGPYTEVVKEKSVDNTGYYLQNHLKLFDSFSLILGLRGDDHETFGTDYNYKISSSYKIKSVGARIKGNYGTGFKVPTVFQLYSSSGNTNLKPERSKSFDIGIEQNILEEKIITDLTYFYNDFQDHIKYDYSTGMYTNVKLKTKGAEIGLYIAPVKILSFNAGYTFTETKDIADNAKLIRIPKHKASLNINYNFIRNANVNLGITYTGKRKDINSLLNIIELKEHMTVDLATYYQVTEIFQISGRIKNVFNYDYQVVYGYAMPGREFYLGVKYNI